jgi:DNA repair protein RadC
MTIRVLSAKKSQILNSEDIYNIMREVLLRESRIRRSQEHFWVAGLNNANKLLFIELVSLGGSNRFNVTAAEVFRIAIYKVATGIILVHNHPSGSLSISKEDKKFTRQMQAAGKILKIKVLDHLVISENEWVSFADEGLL